MAITEMNFASGGGASSADKVSCIDAQGNKSDVQAELNKIYDGKVYSTEEKVIGTWVDGKPLYGKVVQGTLKANAQFCVIPNIERLVEYHGDFYGYNDGKLWCSVIPYYIPSQTVSFLYDGDGVIRNITELPAHVGCACEVSFEYTKTTD